MFVKCLLSVQNQTYTNWRIIVIFEQEDYFITQHATHNFYPIYQPHVDKMVPYYWNLYCNILKNAMPVRNYPHSYFLYLDDDDYLDSTLVLEQLAACLTEDTDGLICQFLRNGKPKPSDALIKAGRIEKGRIGGGCLVLHSRHKDIADWKAKEAADFTWIEEVAAKVKLKFVPLVLQVAGNNGLKGGQAPI